MIRLKPCEHCQNELEKACKLEEESYMWIEVDPPDDEISKFIEGCVGKGVVHKRMAKVRK